jgi:hypothetical protein
MPPSSRKIKDPSALIPLDPKEIRQHVRLLIRHLASIYPRDTPRQTRVILNEIWRVVEYASLQLQKSEPVQALLTLQVVTDICTTQGMHLNDIHSKVSNFFHDLASIWTEILLTVDLTVKERTRWAKQVTTWQTRLAEWSNPAVFDAPQATIREGWDDAALQSILQGTSLQPRTWEGGIPPLCSCAHPGSACSVEAT